jgi:hypothetical protein
MATSLPVPFSHTIEGFTKGIDNQGPIIRVVYKIDHYSDSDKFINALMGFGSLSGPITGGTITKSTPHSHPLSPNLYCQSAMLVEGLGAPVLGANGYPNYDGGALIQAEYRPPPFDFGPLGISLLNNQIDPGTPMAWCTQELSFSNEIWTLGKKMTYASSGKPTDVHVKFYVPITTLRLTFHKLPYMPTPIVRTLRGRVNSTTFLGSPAGTVLFKGAETSREWNTDGTVCQKVVLTFDERDTSQPWNSLPSEDDPTFKAVVGTGGVKMYQLADLSPLVQF